jgi:phenylacetate-CoA ligase
MSLLHRIAGNLVVLAHARGQTGAAYRPPHRWQADRDSRIAATVAYAARTVPFYRRLFAETGIDPRDIGAPEGLAALPLLDKETVRQDPDAFVSRSWRGRRSVPFVTSGSTGEPLRVHHDLVSLLANMAYGERARKTRGLGRGRAPRIVSFSRESGTGDKVHAIYRRWTYVPRRPERIHGRIDRPFQEAIDLINRERPDVITGYGSFLEALFRFVVANGVELHRPERIGYFSDGMSAAGRQLITRAFGVPILSNYTAMESFKIGFTCEAEAGFHVHADICHLRVVDENGVEVPAGQSGEIVISNLLNRGSVLLNYRVGDLGRMATGPCPCGRTFPLLAELEGRKEDLLFVDQDRVIHPRALWTVFGRLPDIVQYQLVQHGRRSFELHIVTRNSASRREMAGAAAAGLRDLLGDVEIEVVAGEEPLSGPGGKVRPAISLCEPPRFWQLSER